MGDRATRILDELHDWMVRENATMIAVICLIIGAKLIGDAITAPPPKRPRPATRRRLGRASRRCRRICHAPSARATWPRWSGLASAKRMTGGGMEPHADREAARASTPGRRQRRSRPAPGPAPAPRHDRDQRRLRLLDRATVPLTARCRAVAITSKCLSRYQSGCRADPIRVRQRRSTRRSALLDEALKRCVDPPAALDLGRPQRPTCSSSGSTYGAPIRDRSRASAWSRSCWVWRWRSEPILPAMVCEGPASRQVDSCFSADLCRFGARGIVIIVIDRQA